MGQSAFFGINVGTQGLYTARTGLDITNHNISNAETKGYSRQYGVQEATRPLNNLRKGMIGTGSEIVSVEQHRDAYLDYKYWGMTSTMGEYEVKNENLSQLELLFNEPTDTGYSKFFNNVFEAINDLSKNPGDKTVRNTFVASLDSFASYMSDMGTQLTTLQREVNFGLKTTVDQINFYSQQLASLNNQIGNLELTGKAANDLRDERNKLVDELSQLVNVEAKEIEDANGKKTFKVTLNGQSLVYDTSAKYLEVRPRQTLNNPEDYVDMYDVYWKSGSELSLDNPNLKGELKGYIDMRDGNNSENFKGDIVSGEGTTSITVENPSRTDLQQTGELLVNGKYMHYNSYTYTPASVGPPAVPESITFDFSIPVTGEKAVAVGDAIAVDDIYGKDYTGTLQSISDADGDGNMDTVVLTNPDNQELNDKGGVIKINNTYVTYTSYSKGAAPGNEITLNVEVPAGTNGTATEMGDDISFKGVPYYIQEFNGFVRTIAKAFNKINESGDGGTGVPLFTFEGYTGAPPQEILDTDLDHSYEQINIHNFRVNDAVLNDLDLVETGAAVNYDESANDLVLKYQDLRHDANMFEQGEPDNYMQALIGEVGIDSQQIAKFKDGQENLLNLVQNQRLSVSGVDLNEETANMLKYQQAYNVAAKIISVMDEIYDTTINRMGAG